MFFLYVLNLTLYYFDYPKHTRNVDLNIYPILTIKFNYKWKEIFLKILFLIQASWSCIVDIGGKAIYWMCINAKLYLSVSICFSFFFQELHYGNFINQMLPLVEEGFKSINAEVKIEAFRAWKQLILNFSTDISMYIIEPNNTQFLNWHYKFLEEKNFSKW